MKVYFTAEFYKLYKKANVRIQNAFDEKFRIFKKKPYDKSLNNHELRDKWEGHRSIDINADWRAIYKQNETNDVTFIYFVTIGTHNHLYKDKRN